MKSIRAIIIGMTIWFLGVLCYTVSFYIPVMEDLEQQANTVLFVVVMPLVWFGSRSYYKGDKQTHGLKLGQTFLFTAAALDAIITVPLFMNSKGVNHYDFFTSPGFWIIALEFIAITVMYWYIKIYPKIAELKS